MTDSNRHKGSANFFGFINIKISFTKSIERFSFDAYDPIDCAWAFFEMKSASQVNCLRK